MNGQCLRGEGLFQYNFATANVNSLLNKVSAVYNFLLEFNISVLSVCETWLVSSMPTSYVDVPGFVVFRGDVEGDIRKHGTCLYVSQNLKCVPVEANVPNLVAVYFAELELYVLSVYRPPSYTELENNSLKNFLLNFCIGREVVVMGDFNLPSIAWSAVDESRYATPLDLSFYDVFCTLGLHQWVFESTFIDSGNVLDLVFTSESDRLGELMILPPLPRCHHSPVVFEYFLESEIAPSSCNTCYYLWFKADYDLISDSLNDIDWISEFTDRTVNECFQIFVSIIWSLVEEFVPRQNGATQPSWMRAPPRRLMQLRSQAWSYYKLLRAQLGRRHERVLDALTRFTQLNYEYRHFLVNKSKQL